MASTVEARRLTEGHRLAQARLGAATVQQMLAAWPLLDVDDLDATFDRWATVVTQLLKAQRGRSEALARNYLVTFRGLELGPSAWAPAAAPVVADEAIRTTLLVTGPARIRSAAVTEGRLVDRAIETARTETAREAIRHVLDGGRGVVLASTRSDRQALGWARATSGSPCHFCAMLASRGPVYDQDTVRFDSHAGCSCTAEPVYRESTEWPPGSRRYAELWQEAKRVADVEDVRTDIAFRRLIEGRA